MPHCYRKFAISLLVSVGPAAVALGDNGYEPISDWNSLPISKAGTTSGILSSYDRNQDLLGVDGQGDTNTDFGQYSGVGSTDPSWHIYGSVSGPGVVTRFWMPHNTADQNFGVRFIADGTVVLNTTTQALLGGVGGQASTGAAGTNANLFQGPLVTTLLGGQVSYEPITYQHSLVVESNATSPFNWYQVNYHSLPASATVPTYSNSLTPSQQAARASAVGLLQNAGSNPSATAGSDQTISLSGQSMAAGGSLTLANLSSAGTIRALKIKLGDGSTTPTDAQLDGVYLRVRYDSSANNAVDVPLSQFFGVGHGRASYQSLPLGVNPSDHSYYSYWPMPFQKNAIVELVNKAGGAISSLSASVEYDPTAPSLSADYFHAVANSQTTTAGQKSYNLLRISGSGHYVGNLMSVTGAGFNTNTLEGDDFITVDGTRHQYGTGFEDAYNGGFYFNHALQNSTNGDIANPVSGTEPYYGVLQDTQDLPAPFRVDAYRWMIGDYVPFTTGIDVSMENYGTAANVDFSSTALYYSTDVPEPALSVLLAVPLIGLLKRQRC